MKHPEVPSFSYRLFKWFCKETLFEELEGDLEESLLKNKEKYGLRKARRIYTSEVFRMLRPTILKKSKSGPVYSMALMANYSVVAYRNLSKNKLFSLINVLGLSMSLAIGLLAITFSYEIHSYDNFHENGDRIYRITSTRTNVNEDPYEYATTSLITAERLNDFGGFDKIVPLFKRFSGDVFVGQNLFQVKWLLAGEDFFEVFTFPLEYGDPNSALKEPFSVVVTESLAEKLFGKKNVIGEVLVKNEDSYQITGVVKDPPSNSHIKFEALASISTMKAKPEFETTFQWGNMWMSYVYVLLPENADMDQVMKNLIKLDSEENAKVDRFEITLGLESLDSISPNDAKYNQISPVIRKQTINRILVLAAIVLFSAGFNYSNLSLARSMKRSKEVGVRKVVGATRIQLFIQFIFDSILMSLVSLTFAYLLFLLIKPEFLNFAHYITNTTTLELTPLITLFFLLLAVLVGLFSGSVPSIVMTRFTPTKVLKGIHKMKVSKGFHIREVMAGIQFMLTMGFAILVILTYKQYSYAMNFDLGFETENILNVDLQNNNPDILRSAFANIPEVEGISSSSFIPSTGITNSAFAKLPESIDSVDANTLGIDAKYLENLGHELLAGENFTSNSDGQQVIVNEQFLKRFQIDLSEAVGTRIQFDEESRTIIGVVKDFHYGTVYKNIDPFVLVTEDEPDYLNLKIQSSDIVKTMAKLEEAWSSVDSKHPFKANFYEDQIAVAYTDLSTTMKTFGLLAIVAISISILGLLGMAVYTTESRLKELTIRKVLGATFTSMTLLLSRSFVKIFLIASLIAIPSTYYFFTQTVLTGMKYRIDIGPWELGSGALLIIFIALITISTQTFKAAKTNPATNLRNE